LNHNNGCVDYTYWGVITILCVTGIIVYYLYLDAQFKKAVKTPEKANKITIRVLAAGFTLAYGAMLLPTSKETLDFHLYSFNVQLYSITRAIIFLGMIVTALITGGTYLAKFIKGNGGD
jgi:hypothetical protein